LERLDLLTAQSVPQPPEQIHAPRTHFEVHRLVHVDAVESVVDDPLGPLRQTAIQGLAGIHEPLAEQIEAGLAGRVRSLRGSVLVAKPAICVRIVDGA